MDEIMASTKEANPIILIPGIGGTRLVDASNGKTAWGSYGYNSFWPSTEKDNKLLALPLAGNSTTSGQAKNKVKPMSVIEQIKINLFPFSTFDLAIYATVVSSLEKAGYILHKDNQSTRPVKPHTNTPMFEFAYDWRESNADSAIKLSNFIKAKSKELESKKLYKKGQKFNIICHSMGCLTARYYLRYGDQGLGTNETAPKLDWRGGDKIENIIMVAPPNKGSGEALKNLLNGFNLDKIKWLKYPSAVLGTMPSMYELLPRKDIVQVTDQEGGKINLLDPKLWQAMSWGILNPNQEKILAQIAPAASTSQKRYSLAKNLQAQLLQKAELFHSRLDIKSKPPKGLKFYLFAGVGEPTESKVHINTDTKSSSFKSTKSGDGAVLRASAYAIEDTKMPEKGSIIEWENAIFFLSNHLGLVRNNDFFVNLYDILMWRETLSKMGDKLHHKDDRQMNKDANSG
ncbi:triacylglycerol lipase [Synechococcus sp. UW140]|uniref:esterase/lipase family protein n=1 Tax=Synechococcus sp. UW140 TaxID=368503 RepID=UPI000E0E4BBB|nr:hypothetical protein [Synechococcus sp. UW140]